MLTLLSTIPTTTRIMASQEVTTKNKDVRRIVEHFHNRHTNKRPGQVFNNNINNNRGHSNYHNRNRPQAGWRPSGGYVSIVQKISSISIFLGFLIFFTNLQFITDFSKTSLPLIKNIFLFFRWRRVQMFLFSSFFWCDSGQ